MITIRTINYAIANEKQYYTIAVVRLLLRPALYLLRLPKAKTWPPVSVIASVGRVYAESPLDVESLFGQ